MLSSNNVWLSNYLAVSVYQGMKFDTSEGNSVSDAIKCAHRTHLWICIWIKVKYLHGMLTLTYKTTILNYDVFTYYLFNE